jgi:hypothetical protein
MVLLQAGPSSFATDFLGALYLALGLLLAAGVAMLIPYLSRRSSQRRYYREEP